MEKNMIDCKIEEDILYQEYENCVNNVKSSPFHKLMADEKIKHSMQVIGAGNYIMKHEQYYQNQTEDYLRYAKLAYLFHDIGRFREICELYQQKHGHFVGSKYDHGLFGAQYLEQTQNYNSPFIVIPVQYHNKLMDEYYNSDDYKQLGDIKNSVTEILKLVRDADKIANFQLITTQTEKMKKLFCPEADDHKDLSIQPEILTDFMNEKNINLHKVKTACDRIINLLSWVYDLNYLPSFVFCAMLKCFDKMLNILKEYNPDAKTQELVEKKFKSYINKQYKILSSN